MKRVLKAKVKHDCFEAPALIWSENQLEVPAPVQQERKRQAAGAELSHKTHLPVGPVAFLKAKVSLSSCCRSWAGQMEAVMVSLDDN